MFHSCFWSIYAKHNHIRTIIAVRKAQHCVWLHAHTLLCIVVIDFTYLSVHCFWPIYRVLPSLHSKTSLLKTLRGEWQNLSCYTMHYCMARVNLTAAHPLSLSLPYAYIATGQAPHNVGSNDDVVGGGVSCHLHVVPGIQVPAASLPPPTVSLLWGDLHSGLGLCLHWGHHHSVRPRD